MLREIHVTDDCKSLIKNPLPINEGGNSLIYESFDNLVLKKLKLGEELNCEDFHREIEGIRHIADLSDNKHFLAPQALIFQKDNLTGFLKKRSYGLNLWNLVRTTPIMYLETAFANFENYLNSIGHSGILLDDLRNEILITPRKKSVLLEVADLESSTNFQNYNTSEINVCELSKFLAYELFIEYYESKASYLKKIECVDGELEAMLDITNFLKDYFLLIGTDYNDIDSSFSMTFKQFLESLKKELETYKTKDFETLDDFDQALIRM